MDQLPSRMAAVWNSLSPARRGMLAATGGGLVALALLLYSWSSSTEFVALYSGLDPSDSGRIVDQLRSGGTDFELQAGGATILVPESQVDELRLNFAAQGLPQGGHVGFELFDGNAFTATDFVQRLNFQRGLQGELARTIESFSVVESARVHIVLPERSLFVADERPATASVVLQMRPGRALASQEVAGIAHLVAGAVEGLDKANITIVDTSGSVIYDGPARESDAALGASGSQLEMQRAFEQTLERDVQQLLDRALGPARSAVQVSATLDFNRLETETESFAPGPEGADGVPRSTVSVSEEYSTTGLAVTGAVPGAVANIPGADTSLPGAETAPEETATSYSRSETTSNYEVGRTITRSVQAVGGVKRLSVSLLLDDTVTEEQATSLSAAVAAAVGIDGSRGDAIVVSRIPFDRSAIAEAEAAFAAEASTAQLMSYARMGLPVLLLLVAFVFFRLLVRSVSRRAAYRLVDVPQGALTAGAAAGGGMELAAGQAQRGMALPPPEPEEMKSEVEQQVTRMAESHPDTVAGVVQSWLREE